MAPIVESVESAKTPSKRQRRLTEMVVEPMVASVTRQKELENAGLTYAQLINSGKSMGRKHNHAVCHSAFLACGIGIVARVMIAQWENECISPSVLSVARVTIVQQENQCISLSVLSMARVVIARWDSSLTVLPVARVPIPAMAEYFKVSSTPHDNTAWQHIATHAADTLVM